MTTVVGEWELSLSNGEILIAEICADGVWDRTFWKNGALKLYPAKVETEHLPEERAVVVRAERYVHAVELEGDAVFEDNCFSLLPGETRRISYDAMSDTAITLTAYTIGE